MKNAKNAYGVYKSVLKKPYTDVSTKELNALYSVQLRMSIDSEYKSELVSFVTEEGEGLDVLIEKYFDSYNASYGLEIRDSLTGLHSEGGYFIIKTYKKEGESLIPTRPTEFKLGDAAFAKLNLFDCETDEDTYADLIKYTVKTDDGETYSGEVENTNTLELDLKLSRPGWIYINAQVCDKDGNELSSFVPALGGVLFDFEKITLTKESPEDLAQFWEKAIDRLLEINPTDKTPDGYSGLVMYEFDMPKENYFSLTKFDGEYIKKLREYDIGGVEEGDLEKCDFYELNLKAPGPCHSSNILSVPKVEKGEKMPILVTFDGYTARPITPSYGKSYILLHCSHHGYTLPRPYPGYYDILRAGVCKHYGLGNGDINSLYEDLNDNYMLYLHLRNLQAIRFVTTPAFSHIVPDLNEIWNGEVRLEGGSMGGYQTICTAALLPILQKKSAPFKLTDTWINVPAFCDLAGREDGRVPCMTYYTEGMEYFDAAHLAALVNVPMLINRVGLGDTICSPNGICAMFNNIPKSVPREINFLQNSSHGILPEKDKQEWIKYKFE